MRSVKCSQCGTEDLHVGFLEDSGQSAQGATRWIPGPLETGIFGGAKRFGKERYQVDAFRCSQCGHLELFVTQRV
jgi:hypothetical protein